LVLIRDIDFMIISIAVAYTQMNNGANIARLPIPKSAIKSNGPIMPKYEKGAYARKTIMVSTT
jgi:hypothetical protein